MRNHWHDVGLGLAIAVAIFLGTYHSSLTSFQIFLWVSFIGIVLGLMLIYAGILKTLDWLKDTKTSFVFPSRCVNISKN